MATEQGRKRQQTSMAMLFDKLKKVKAAAAERKALLAERRAAEKAYVKNITKIRKIWVDPNPERRGMQGICGIRPEPFKREQRG